MLRTRREIIQLGVAASAGALSSANAAFAQGLPQGPIRFIVPFGAGGGVDVITRIMLEQMKSVPGWQQTVVENKSGANTIIAVQSLLGAPRDGSTFLVTIAPTMLLPHLVQNLPFNPAADLVPVSALTYEQLVLYSNASTGIRTVAQLVEKVRSGGNFAFGSYAAGSIAHLLYFDLQKAVGKNMVYVPYKGMAPMTQAVLSGEVSFGVATVLPLKQHIAAGKLVPLAVTGAQRSRFLPDVPTLEEVGIKGFDTPSWIGVFAARGVPESVLKIATETMGAAVRAPEFVARINDLGAEAGQMSLPQFTELIKRDRDNLGRKIDAAGVRLE